MDDTTMRTSRGKDSHALRRWAMPWNAARRMAVGLAALVLAVPLAAGCGPEQTTTVSSQTDAAKPRPKPTTHDTQPTPADDTRADRPVAKAGKVADINLDELPRGEAPQVPWFDAGVIRNGDKQTVVGEAEGFKGTISFQPIDQGYLVEFVIAGEGPTFDTVLYDEDGGVRRQLPEEITTFPAVSPDGQVVAWSDPHVDVDAIIATDARTGKDIGTARDVEWGYPVDFLNGDLVYAIDASEDLATGYWDLDSGEVGRLDISGSVLDTNGEGRMLVQRYVDDATVCAVMLDMSDASHPGEILWKNCDLFVPELTDDGRYALGYTGVDHADGLLLDAKSGEVVLKLDTGAGTVGNPVMESEGTVLVEVTQNNQTALVRCSLEGECELATDVRPMGSGTVFALAGKHLR